MSQSYEFFVGLGGVGGRALMEIRRVIQQHQAEAEKLSVSERWKWLYFDTNDDIIHSSRGEENISLLPSEVLIADAHRDLNGRHISDYTEMMPWLGGMEDSYNARGLADMVASGQLRRYGRFLFSLHANDIRQQLRSALESLPDAEPKGINFHLFASLGGGTGSGCLVDMISLIQSLAAQMQISAEIYVYPFITLRAEDFCDVGPFHQNEYATLRDLNALMTDCYHPHLTADAGVEGPAPSVCQEFAPIRKVCISSDSEFASLREQSEHMAKAVFDSILYASVYGKTDAMGWKSFIGEDLFDEPETEPLRCCRYAFLTQREAALPVPEGRTILRAAFEKRVLEEWRKGDSVSAAEKHSRDEVEFQELYERENQSLAAAIAEEEKKRGDVVPAPECPTSAKAALAIVRSLCEDAEKHIQIVHGMQEDLALESTCEPCCTKDINCAVEEVRTCLMRHFTESSTGKRWGVHDMLSFLGHYLSWRETKAATLQQLQTEATAKDKVLADAMTSRHHESEAMGVFSRLLSNKPAALLIKQQDDATARVRLADEVFLWEKSQKTFKAVTLCIQSMIRNLQAVLEQLRKRGRDLEMLIERSRDAMAQAVPFADGHAYAETVRNVQEAMSRETTFVQRRMEDIYLPLWLSKMNRDTFCSPDDLRSIMDEVSHSLIAHDSKECHDTICEKSGLQSVWEPEVMPFVERVAGDERDLWEKRLGTQVDHFIESLILGNGSADARRRGVLIGMPTISSRSELTRWLAQRMEKAAQRCSDEIRCSIYRLDGADSIRVLYYQYGATNSFVNVAASLRERYRKRADSEAETDRRVLYFANLDDAGIPLESPERPSLLN